MIPGDRHVIVSYPRWRGDDARVGQDRQTRLELPPLARGRLDPGDVRPGDLGATPAGAGTTQSGASGRGGRTSYPRWRGDDAPPACADSRSGELPPLARGRRPGRQQGQERPGATPAGAGTTGTACASSPGRTSYPRWRGDDDVRPDTRDPSAELPPLARGRPWPRALAGARARATPAGAGTTRARRRCARKRWSYPRWRGDDTS